MIYMGVRHGIIVVCHNLLALAAIPMYGHIVISCSLCTTQVSTILFFGSSLHALKMFFTLFTV